MQFDQPPVVGRFQRRYKRFFADVELEDGSTLTAHCPNTGSLLGCKDEGLRAWLRDSNDEKRKLRFTWQAVEVGGTWVNVDTNLPNRVVREAFEAGKVPGFEGLRSVRSEVNYGNRSRIDLLLEDQDGRSVYVEVKNTTLAEDGTARFPDAVTARGLKHLGELEQVVREGHRALQLFFVSRDDVERFRPAYEIDPAYCAKLVEVASKGVEVRAFTALVTPAELTLHRELPVDLSGAL
ncbi:MAG: DNA/RNA nuclease SfsA [Planctomycetota bacterium]